MSKHVVGNYEENGYHDSYFKAVLWDDEARKIEHVEIGATAYAGGECRRKLTDNETAWIDANAYIDRIKAEVSFDVDQFYAERYNDSRNILIDNNVDIDFIDRVSLEDLEDIAAIFSNRVRNSFKKKMRNVVKSWAPGNGYETPLSPKQLAYIRRPMKDQYGRTTQLHDKRSIARICAPLSIMRGFGAK
jgi:hypothetical protein